jgi:hypothetical protein
MSKRIETKKASHKEKLNVARRGVSPVRRGGYESELNIKRKNI